MLSKMKKKTNEQQLIRDILGIDKFLQLNMELVKAVGLTEAVLLTYILDKCEYNISIGNIKLTDEGVIVYRKELENKFNLSAYEQRKAEKSLIEFGLLDIKTYTTDLTTYNLYIPSLEGLYNLLIISAEKEIVY